MSFNIILKNVPHKSVLRLDLDLFNLGNATKLCLNNDGTIEYFGILSVPIGIHYLQLNPNLINQSSYVIIGQKNRNIYLCYDAFQENLNPTFADEEDICIRKGIENLTFLQNSIPYKTSHSTLLLDTLKHTELLQKLLVTRYNLGAVAIEDFMNYVHENTKLVNLKQTSCDNMDCLVRLTHAHYSCFSFTNLEQEAILNVSVEFCLFYLLCALLLLNEKALETFVGFFSNICNTDTSQYNASSVKIAEVLVLIATYLYSENDCLDCDMNFNTVDVNGFLTYIELVHDCYSDKKIINLANIICVS